MPRITVSIQYDEPEDPYWLNPDNVRRCLEEVCKNTQFDVTWDEATGPDPGWLDDTQREVEPEVHLWHLMGQLERAFRERKPDDRTELDRRYAIVLTDLEKIRAYWGHFVVGELE